MKRWFVFSALILVVLSSLVIAQDDSCSGFWGSVKCVLWGDPSLRENVAGEAIVGEASSGNVVGETSSRGNLAGREFFN